MHWVDDGIDSFRPAVMLGCIMKSSGHWVGRFILARSFSFLFFAACVTGAPLHALELMTARDLTVAPIVGANGDSVEPWLSQDGRFVLFTSLASDLVTNDNAWLSTDVVLRDRVNNTTTLVSENFPHTGGGDYHSSGICVATNGRYVLFESFASDLVNNDTNGLGDVFVRDLQTETTILVSVAADGGAGNDRSDNATMTPDGRYVAFVSSATNLVVADTNNIPDVFVRDLQAQTTTLVSVGASNTTAVMGPPAISADGRWVAFFSSARNLMPGVSNISRGEIYLRDLVTGTTLWPSANAIALVRSNLQFNSTPVPMHPVLSADGRYVTFACGWTNNATTPPSGTTPATVVMQFDATTLTTTVIDTNGYPPTPYNNEVYGPEATPDGRFVAYAARVTNGVSAFCTLRCWDRQTGTAVGVSVDLIGGVSSNRTAVAPVLSADGRYIAFFSDATNLVSNTISNGPHLYRRDLWANTTELVDADLVGVGSAGDLYTMIPALSADGRYVAYSAPDGNLVEADSNVAEDVFVRDMTAVTNELISVRQYSLVATAGNAATASSHPSPSADGNRVAYASLASNLVGGDNNRSIDVFVWDRLWQSNLLVSVGMDGFPAQGGVSVYPQISADGHFVLFVSGATNLVANDTNGVFDVFLRDLDLQTTTRVSITTNGVSLGSHDGPFTAMTPDAQRVVFTARTNAAMAGYQLFWRDLASGETRLISSSASSTRPVSVSTNGQRVAYQNGAGNLFVWNAGTGTTIYSSAGAVGSAFISPSGNRLLYQAAGQLTCYDLTTLSVLGSWSGNESIRSLAPWSADERYVVFVTSSALISADTNGVNDVYLCDLQTGTRSLVSANISGTAAGSDGSDAPMFSADGRFIAFRSQATNLLTAPTTAPGLFRLDRVTGSNQLIVAKSLVPGYGWFSAPLLSADGATVTFNSVDSGLASGDLNRTTDAFVGSFNVLSLADGDADGIPDWWLQQYFGHANGQANDLSRPGDDADGDGLTNYEELLTGTNPSDAASVLEIQITLTPPSGTNVVLSWPALAGKNYRVQFSDDVAAGNWQNLTTAVQVAGGQGWVNVTRTNLARVFRVRCEP